MNDRRAAARYAEALLEAAREQGRLEPVRQELRALAAAVEEAPELREFLARPDLEAEQKERAVVSALDLAGASNTVVSLLRVLLRHRRGQELAAVAEVYEELADAAEGIVRVEACTVIPLTGEQRERLEAALSRLTGGKQVILRERVEPDLLAGMTVQIGDDLIDGSAAGRLARMREALLNAEW